MNLVPVLLLASLCSAGNKNAETPITGVPSVNLPATTPLNLPAGFDTNVAPLTNLNNLSAVAGQSGAPVIPTLPVSAVNLQAHEQKLNATAPLAPEGENRSAGQSALTPIAGDVQAGGEINPQALAVDKAPSTAPDGWMAKMGRLLSSVAGAFGGGKKSEPPPQSEAQKLDREFQQIDIWGEIRPQVVTLVEQLRAKKLNKAQTREYIKKEADLASQRIMAKAGSTNLGFHYNLHGGQREEYVGKGIRATMGDIANNYSMNGDKNLKVYFFQLKEHSLFNVLDEGNPAILMLPSRMGSALNVFRLDAPELTAAMADGRIQKFGGISMDFHGMSGVPYSTYVAPPLEVFVNTKKKMGGMKLSRDEETLATIMYLEAALAKGPAYIPKKP